VVNGVVQKQDFRRFDEDPLTSIFVEPAKILFLNNAINHGIFSPLGIQQASEAGG
jgi:mannitol-specific phosphotransferase system IIBC component